MTVPGDSHRPHDRSPYELFWCDACRLGQLQPRPSQAEADAFYDIPYCTHVTEVYPRPIPPHALVQRARVRLAWAFDRGSHLDADLLHDLVRGEPSSFCDLGCGNGWLIAALRERGHRVVGVEPDPVARRLAVQRELTVHAGHADAPPEAVTSQSFDVVVLDHVLHLCLDPRRVLENARRLLRPGGIVVCEVTNNEAAGLQQSGDCWRWLDIPRHVTLFTSASLSRMCAAAGLQVKSVRFGGYTRQFRSEWIEDEVKKRAALYPPTRGKRVRSYVRNLQLLVRTAFARPESKYDSVRVVAAAAPG
jgi:SAM-dependent methyltransferase